MPFTSTAMIGAPDITDSKPILQPPVGSIVLAPTRNQWLLAESLWYKFQEIRLAGRRRTYIDSSRTCFLRWPLWMKTHSRDWLADDRTLKVEYLAQFLEWVYKKESNSFATKIANIVIRVLRWADACGIVRAENLKLVQLPKVIPTKIGNIITPRDYEALKEAAKTLPHPDLYRLLLILGWHTGMSHTDAHTIAFRSPHCNIDMEKLIIHYYRQKTETEAIIPFEAGSELHEELLARFAAVDPNEKPNSVEKGVLYVSPILARKELVTMREHERSWWQETCRIKITHVFTAAGLPHKRYKDFRTTFCSMLANGGVNTILACLMSGHKNPNVFKQYVRPDIESMREQLLRARRLSARLELVGGVKQKLIAA